MNLILQTHIIMQIKSQIYKNSPNTSPKTADNNAEFVTKQMHK